MVYNSFINSNQATLNGENKAMTTIKTAQQATAILAECKTVAELNKAMRGIYKQLDECRLSRETVRFYGQCRKHEILTGKI